MFHRSALSRSSSRSIALALGLGLALASLTAPAAGQALSAPLSGALTATTDRGIVTIPASIPGGGFSISPTEGLASGGTVVAVTPPVAEAHEFTSIASGALHTVAIGRDGKTYAWGSNEYGQLGDGSTSSNGAVVEVHAPAGVSFVEVAAGSVYSLALGSDGNTYAWGANGNGQLGHGAHEPDASVPTPVTLPDGVTFTSIAAGSAHALAIGSDGKTYAWGLNYYGQLGNGEHSDRGEPAEVATPAGVTFSEVSAGWMHSLALTSDGDVFAWGLNENGQVSESPADTNVPVPSPVVLPDDLTATSIGGGGYYSVALATDGAAYMWGNQTRPDQPSWNQRTPARVDFEEDVTLTELSAGHDHVLALGADAKTYAWGRNQYGQLGNDTIAAMEDAPVPVELPAGVSFAQVQAGTFRSFALDADGSAFHWGDILGLGDDMPIVPTGISAVTVASMTFGGVDGTGLTKSGDVWAVTTPAHAVGPVNVVMGWMLGGIPQSSLTLLDGFTYLPEPPGPPTDLSGAPGNFEVALSWNAPADDGGGPVTDYMIEYSTDSGATWAVFADGTSSDTHITVTDLENGVPHVFRVTAVNAAGAGTSTRPSAGYTPVGFGVTYLGSFGASTGPFNARVVNPWHVAVDPDGNVFVSDRGNQRVVRFAPGGAFVAATPRFNGLSLPAGVEASADRVYATILTSDTVNIYTTATAYVGSFINRAGMETVPTLQGIAVSPSGVLYMADTANNRIHKRTHDSTTNSTWGGTGTAEGRFDTPWDVAIGPDGSVYVTDLGNRRVQRFDGDGGFLGAWGLTGNGDPMGIDVADDGTVYVVDSRNSRVIQLTADLEFISTWDSGDDGTGTLSSPRGLAVGPDHSIYVSETADSMVRRYIPTRLLPPGQWTRGVPTISGTAQAGHALTADPGSWLPIPDSLAYQWLRDGAAIAGATGSTYESTPADAGARLSVRVTAAKAEYEPASATSVQTEPVAPGEITGALTIGWNHMGSTLLVGEIVTANGAWAPASATATYQWLRNGVPIPGATAVTYTVTLADAQTSLSATATAAAPGFAPLTVSSTRSHYVQSPFFVNEAIPTVSGQARTGHVVTAEPGTWFPSPTSFSYQWWRVDIDNPQNAVAIGGATAKTYSPVPADLGKRLTVTVSALRADYPDGVATSHTTSQVTAGSALEAPVPAIGGDLVAGATLTAQPGAWKTYTSATVTLTYQWLRGSTPIAGATGKTYALTDDDIGRFLRVTVSGSAPGFHPASRTSQEVGPVAPATPPADQGGATMTITDANGDPVTEAEQGEELDATLDGFAEGSDVDGFGYSTPLHLGTWTTDFVGRATIRFVVPTTLEPGMHTFVFLGENGEGEFASISQRILVTAADTPLAATGGRDDGSLLGATALLVAAAGLLLVLRRRRHAAAVSPE